MPTFSWRILHFHISYPYIHRKITQKRNGLSYISIYIYIINIRSLALYLGDISYVDNVNYWQKVQPLKVSFIRQVKCLTLQFHYWLILLHIARWPALDIYHTQNHCTELRRKKTVLESKHCLLIVIPLFARQQCYISNTYLLAVNFHK